MTTMSPPPVLLVMGRNSYDGHFDERRLRRLRSLAALGDVVLAEELDSPELREQLSTVEVLMTGWGAPQLTAERLERMPRLRAVIHCAGTIRPLVSDAFWERSLLVSTAADTNAIPVAEFTLAAVILAGKKAPFLAAEAQASAGAGGGFRSFGPSSNFGQSIGLVGFSRVGRRVLSLLQTLDEPQCLVADPFADASAVEAAGGTLLPLDEILPRVSILSLHAPTLPSTHHMIGRAQLAALPDHATVINTARGSLIDTAALERECASGRLNAILDVTEPEPLPASSALRGLPNVMITPHIAGSLGTELLRLTDAALDELERYVSGEPLRSSLSRHDLLVTA